MNSVNIVGNLVRDPDLKYTQSSTAVAKFGLASNRKFGGKEETTFVDVECWGKTAELVGEHLSKGRKVGVTGRLKTDSWQDKESGQKRSKLVVVAEQVHFMDGRKEAPVSQEAPPSDEIPEDNVPF